MRKQKIDRRLSKGGSGSGGKSGGGGRSAAEIKNYSSFSSEVERLHQLIDKKESQYGLVPIYRIREELGNRVSHSDFDGWLLEMQANDKITLKGGEMPDITPQKAANSIRIFGNLRYYIEIEKRQSEKP